MWDVGGEAARILAQAVYAGQAARYRRRNQLSDLDNINCVGNRVGL